VRRTPVVVVFLTVFIDLLGFGMVVPLLSRYAEDYGATPFQAGLLVASYSIAQFFLAPVWGRLSDRVGRKPVLAWTLAGNAASYALFAAAGGLPLLFVARTLSGAFAANISTAQAYVADVTTPETRAKGMGMIGMAFGLGFVLGPAIGGLLAHHLGVAAPGAAAAVLSAVACAVAATKLPESLPPALRRRAQTRRHPILAIRGVLSDRRVGPLVALFFFLVFGFANLESMLALFLKHRFDYDAQATGWVFVYIGVCIAFAQGFLIGRLARRFGEARLLRIAPLVLAVGMQLYWLAPGPGLFFAAVPFVAVGMGLSNPSVASLVSRRTPADAQGRTLGLMQSVGALARAVSPAVAGWLYGAFQRPDGSVAPFVVGGVLVVLGVALGWPALGTNGGGAPASEPAPAP
jgi:MFS transporter, DHA1 family, tetracycline resistance protein